MPLAWEADVTPVLRRALADGKTLALPLCDVDSTPKRMTLRRVEALQDLVPGAYGIPEPSGTAEVIPVTAVDLMLVPLEGIDATGMRLGKGGGYYDRLLDGATVHTLGCAMSWQWVPEGIPAQPWDRSLNACADATGIRIFNHLK